MQIICQIWGETGILQIFDLIWSKVQTVDGWQIIQENDWDNQNISSNILTILKHSAKSSHQILDTTDGTENTNLCAELLNFLLL